MHIEPGLVSGAKIALSYVTAAASFGLLGHMATTSMRNDGGVVALLARSVITTLLVLAFFELAPHYPVGVSEVHLILGSTLFLLFGGGAASIGLAAGLLLQGLLFEPIDLPQYGMNVTSLLMPLWGVSLVAKKIIAPKTAYVDLNYSQALLLSTSYQGGIVAWVAFWAFYGDGLATQNLAAVGSFGAAYMSVVILEPLIDLAVLALAKTYAQLRRTAFFNVRLYGPA